MTRQLTAGVLVAGAVALVALWGCPPVVPPGSECGGADSACTIDSDCCDGLTCTDGACAAPPSCASEGEACTDAADCCGGLTCTGGVCAAPPSCAGEAEACTDAADCCDGLTCTDGACAAPSSCADVGDACTDASDCCDGLTCADGACEPPPSGTEPEIPAKTLGLDLIGVHDRGSSAYDDNCIGCHTDRSDEVAQDGVTPAAHARMAALFGTGNDRCIACHDGGPNFITFSAGALRKQVSMGDVGCAGCHGANATPSFYAK